MYRHPESNPHFLPRNGDTVIEFTSRTPAPRTKARPPDHPGRTSVEPTYAPRPQPPLDQPQPQFQVQSPPDQHHPPPQISEESRPHLTAQPPSPSPGRKPTGRGHSPSRHGQHHHHASLLQAPRSRRTRPVAWLVAVFCALFWIIVIVGGLIILIVYLVFRPRDPRFDLSSATFNAAYLDMGYLLNADITLLANFTNPNTKVNVDFSFIAMDLYYEKNFIATRFVEPFSVMRRESMFAGVNMVASQVRLSMGLSSELQRQMGNGRVNFEIRGVIKTRSRLGGFFQYSYWLYPHCQIEVTSPPSGVLIRKRCVTNR